MLPVLHSQVLAFIKAHSLQLDKDVVVKANRCKHLAIRARKDIRTKQYNWALALKKLVKQVSKAAYDESSKLPVQAHGAQLPTVTANTLVRFSYEAAHTVQSYGPMVADDDTDTYDEASEDDIITV